MTRFFLFSICFIYTLITQAQPSIVWQKSLGGPKKDIGIAITQTLDGGYFMTGYNYFSDYGSLVKLDNSGSLVWEKWPGLYSYKGYSSVREIADSSLILGGSSILAIHNSSYYVGRITKFSQSGVLIWDQLIWYGTNVVDNSISDFIVLDDKSMMATGYYRLQGITNNSDLSLIKLDSLGSIQWHKEFGGDGGDFGRSIINAADGGYLIAGLTNSNNGDVTGNHSENYDIWLLKTNSNGEVEWKKCFGGSKDDRPFGVVSTSDGGFIITGVTSSNDGDVSHNNGGSDIWVFKINAVGEIIWEKTIGGSADDSSSSICSMQDGTYMIAGSALSNDGDVQDNHGNGDCYLVKIDNNGNVIASKTFGGTKGESATHISPTDDKGLIMCGTSYSNDGDLTENHGDSDYWIVKLTDVLLDATDPQLQDNESLRVYPNPAHDYLMLDISSVSKEVMVTITKMNGQYVMQQTLSDNRAIDISSLKSGLYNLILHSNNQRIHVANFIKI